jgi:hypothetical protein
MLRLLHVEQTDLYTLGILLVDKIFRFVTIELPWKSNQKDISCIPNGNFMVTKINSPKHGNCFGITGVPEREDIEIHSANTADQLEGCIAVGLSWGYMEGKRAVFNSRIALKNLLDAMPKSTCITITDCM